MLSFALGLIYSSFLEWWIHKDLFHKYGRKKGSPFSFHLREHHATSKKNGYRDDRVSKMEVFGLGLLSILHLPILYVSPGFYYATLLYAILFFVVHNTSHRNPKLTKKYLPWHWRHHMDNPNRDWNVVFPIADKVMKTGKNA